MTAIAVEALKSFAVELLVAGGFHRAHAKDTAQVLVWANARGTASHGVLRIPRYVELVEQGRINAGANLVEEDCNAAICILNAQNMPGATAMLAGMDKAVDIAGQFGFGWCSVKNITHAGAVGYYALRAVERGMLGIVLSASMPLMAYHGARASGLSTNPIAIAVPSSGEPLLLDMSTSTAALGKILHAKDTNSDIPADWGLDENGRSTTNPNRVETLTPLGGPKGSGLSLMIEIIASVLVANPVLSEALNSKKAAMNGVALAVDISRFTDIDTFALQLTDLVSAIKQLPKAAETDSILMPGERGYRQMAHCAENGIDLSAGTVNRLKHLATQLDVSCPVGL